jgi:AMP-binding enzyme C-terminal domain
MPGHCSSGRHHHHRPRPPRDAARALTRPHRPDNQRIGGPADHAEPAIIHTLTTRVAEDHQDHAKITVRALRKIEVKRLRLRILATTGWLVRSARHRVLHIDPTSPRTELITTAHAGFSALPVPDHHPQPEHQHEQAAWRRVDVPRPGVPVEPAELVAFCRGRLGTHQRPRSVDIVDTLPRTATGMVRKRELRERYRTETAAKAVRT